MLAKTSRFLGVSLAMIALLVIMVVWYDHATSLRRALGIDSLPGSVEVLHEYSASWTDFYHEWIISIEPDHAQQLLAGHPFVPRDLEAPAALYQSETGAHGIMYVSKEESRDLGVPVFTIGSAYKFLDAHDTFIGVAFSESRDRAFINISGD